MGQTDLVTKTSRSVLVQDVFSTLIFTLTQASSHTITGCDLSRSAEVGQVIFAEATNNSPGCQKRYQDGGSRWFSLVFMFTDLHSALLVHMCSRSLTGFQEPNWKHHFSLSPSRRSSVMPLMKTTTKWSFE